MWFFICLSYGENYLGLIEIFIGMYSKVILKCMILFLEIILRDYFNILREIV